jgi:hypothetical protein
MPQSDRNFRNFVSSAESRVKPGTRFAARKSARNAYMMWQLTR